MSELLKDKIAIITGAGRGLGRAFALRFAKGGAKLLLPDINLKMAQLTAKAITKEGGQAVAIETDISNETSTKKMAEKVMQLYGRVDILLNNAALAYFPAKDKKLWDAWLVEEWDRVFAVNVRGTWLCCKAVVPLMVKQNKGKIINMVSNTIKIHYVEHLLHYACSKGAIYTMTQLLARDLGSSNINVNGIAPGLTATEATLGMVEKGVSVISKEGWKTAIKDQSIHRRGEPKDLEGLAVFFASDDSDFITGQIMFVDGGCTSP